MFQALQLEVMERYTTVEQHFRESRRLRSNLSKQAARGLVFVELYAIHEYTVRSVVRIAIDAIAAHAHRYTDLRPSLLAMFLDPELCSLRDTSPRNIWDRRLVLLERATSNDPVSLAGLVLPIDGTHFRHTHVNLILKVFGVTQALTIDPRHLFRIDEVVDKRNAITHGEETAQEVGRGFSRGDIRQVIRQMKSICLRLILIVSQHCNEPAKHCR
jgi:hypothetical protein